MSIIARIRRRSRRQLNLRVEIERVVNRGNCSGCGGCAVLSPNVSMSLNSNGFLRPHFVGDHEGPADAAAQFRRMCPGIGLAAPDDLRPLRHPELGEYTASWRAWSADSEIRHLGSSGGVLTSLSVWLVSTGRVTGVVGSTMKSDEPRRTVPIVIQSRDEALASAGSRYAPTENMTTWAGRSDRAFVGKPCEISAARHLPDSEGGSHDRPPLLSFFCAGTPSQRATDQLIERLDVDGTQLSSLRYRGAGWPGDFTVQDRSGRLDTMSYKQSWGGHLGRDLQWRCKTCVDGTGQDADLAVGDFWRSDANGFPVFEDGEGSSVLIARTSRGRDLALAAQRDGVVHLEELDLDEVAQVQPLQVTRHRTLWGRLIGRRLAGSPGPRYQGYGLRRAAARRPIATARAAAGTYLRTRRERS